MESTLIEAAGIRVSRICLGTMCFGNPIDEPECRRLVSQALDQGLNFFDTSNSYEGYGRSFGSAGGVSEDLLGRALQGRRAGAVICTKFGNPVGHGPEDAGLSHPHLERELEKSLRRLRTDHIDIVLAHRFQPSIPVERVWELFQRWIEAGKVRAVGVSNWPCWRIAQACETARRRGWTPLAVSSPKYSLIRRGIELEQVACAAHYGFSLVTYQPLEGGWLTGKYRAGEPAPAGSRGAEMPSWIPRLDHSLDTKLETLEGLAAQLDMDLAQYALAWTLQSPRVASVVVGLRSQGQLNAALAAVGRTFPQEHLETIDRLFAPPLPWGGEQLLYRREETWSLENREEVE